MRKIVVLSLPTEVVSEANRRDPWRRKHRRVTRQKSEVAFGLRSLGVVVQREVVAAFQRGITVQVILTRLGARRLDTDNLSIAFKSVRDAIARWAGVDDGDSRWDFLYRQETGKARGIRVEILTEGLEIEI